MFRNTPARSNSAARALFVDRGVAGRKEKIRRKRNHELFAGEINHAVLKQNIRFAVRFEHLPEIAKIERRLLRHAALTAVGQRQRLGGAADRRFGMPGKGLGEILPLADFDRRHREQQDEEREQQAKQIGEGDEPGPRRHRRKCAGGARKHIGIFWLAHGPTALFIVR